MNFQHLHLISKRFFICLFGMLFLYSFHVPVKYFEGGYEDYAINLATPIIDKKITKYEYSPDSYYFSYRTKSSYMTEIEVTKEEYESKAIGDIYEIRESYESNVIGFIDFLLFLYWIIISFIFFILFLMYLDWLFFHSSKKTFKSYLKKG